MMNLREVSRAAKASCAFSALHLRPRPARRSRAAQVVCQCQTTQFALRQQCEWQHRRAAAMTETHLSGWSLSASRLYAFCTSSSVQSVVTPSACKRQQGLSRICTRAHSERKQNGKLASYLLRDRKILLMSASISSCTHTGGVRDVRSVSVWQRLTPTVEHFTTPTCELAGTRLYTESG